MIKLLETRPVVTYDPPNPQYAPRDLASQIQDRLDSLTKPRASLGALESLAKDLGVILGTTAPEIIRPHLLIFAGDHGITAEGVSLYPQEVTGQMVRNFLTGGAAANVFAKLHGVGVSVIDAGIVDQGSIKALSGIRGEDSAAIRFVPASIGPGTRNFLHGPAMTLAEAEKALAIGASLVKDQVSSGTNAVLIGEMGIGNSSSAALVTACLTGSPITSCIGRGTGLEDSAMAHKVDVLYRAFKRPHGVSANPMSVACEFGGFEIVMMAGAYMAAAAHRCIALADGYISSAALLLAEKLQPGSIDSVIFSHRSREQGHSLLLSHWQKHPLLDLDLALGEGTGALLALPLLRAACAMLRDMATFESAAVSQVSRLPNTTPSGEGCDP